jgi:hypothetical protein
MTINSFLEIMLIIGPLSFKGIVRMRVRACGARFIEMFNDVGFLEASYWVFVDLTIGIFQAVKTAMKATIIKNTFIKALPLTTNITLILYTIVSLSKMHTAAA